jgi:hypothetical protein
MQDEVNVTVEGRSEPQLRKLARALISLAQRQLAEEPQDVVPDVETKDAA